jgi:hypothetical protein
MIACTVSCAASHRQKVWRDTNPEDYEKQKAAYNNSRRRENYAYKKKQEAKKIKGES